MDKFDESNLVNGRYYSLWIAGDKYAEVKTASAESSLTTQDVPIAGSMGDGTKVIGGKGSGSLTFHKTFNGLLKKINECISNGKPFTFDLISELNDPTQSSTERVCIDDCTITKFKVIDVDITKLLEQSFDYSYNPTKVTFE